MDNSLLESILLLGDFTREELTLLESKLRFRPAPKNSYLLKEGEVCQSFYFLHTGSCRQFYKTPDNVDVTVNLCVAHDWVSDHRSFLSQKPSDNFIQVLEDSDVTELDVFSFHELIAVSQSFLRLGKLFEVVQPPDYSSGTKSPEKNYAELLIKEPALVKKFPLKYIASYLRITPETLSRIRRRINHL